MPIKIINDDYLVSELEDKLVTEEDKDASEKVEKDLAAEEQIAAKGGHTYNPQQAAEQGLVYTPPTDPPVVRSETDPQGTEVAAGFAPSMEAAEPAKRDLPDRVNGSDLELQTAIYETLQYNSETAHLRNIVVEAINGIVNLRGTVPDEADIARVYSIVRDMAGVVEIYSNLRVA